MAANGIFETIEDGKHYTYVFVNNKWLKIQCADIISIDSQFLKNKQTKDISNKKPIKKKKNKQKPIKKDFKIQKNVQKTASFKRNSQTSKKKQSLDSNLQLGKLFNQKQNIEKHSKSVKKLKSDNLTDSQKWWRNLTLEQQAKWRYNLMLKKKGTADYQFEYE